MHGNVSEWCADGPRRYVAGEKVVDPIGPDGGKRVVRGGSLGNAGGALRSAARSAIPPRSRGVGIGFRLALVLE